MKVVVDTNVYISALVFGGVPERVLDVIQSQDILLYSSPSIREEVAGILLRKFNDFGPASHSTLGLRRS